MQKIVLSVIQSQTAVNNNRCFAKVNVNAKTSGHTVIVSHIYIKFIPRCNLQQLKI